MDDIIKDILQERARQDALFGAPPRNLKATFYLTLLTEELGEIARAIIDGYSPDYRTELIQLAAVAIAAIQEYDSGFAFDDLETVCERIVYQKELNERNRRIDGGPTDTENTDTDNCDPVVDRPDNFISPLLASQIDESDRAFEELIRVCRENTPTDPL